jgi:hypothetical protein
MSGRNLKYLSPWRKCAEERDIQEELHALALAPQLRRTSKTIPAKIAPLTRSQGS